MLARLGRRPVAPVERAASMSMSDYAKLWQQFGFNGVQYTVPSGTAAELTALEGQANPIVAACIHVRAMVFSEIRFAWMPYSGGRPGALFGNQELRILETPWQTASTGDLLARMEVDASLYGNSYWIRTPAGLVRLDPARVNIITGDVNDDMTGKTVGQRLVGYMVVDRNGQDAAMYLADEVAHYAPIPDPLHPFRGRSWLSSVLPDVQADMQMTAYKTSFLANAATPNLVVTFDSTVSRENFDLFKTQMDDRHSGAFNAFKTLYLGGGADVKMVGSNFEQLAIKAVQGAGETRIAAAAGVPAVVLGISEAMQGSALTTGNYGAARRRFADGTIRPLLRFACAALETLVPSPGGGVRLWFDDRDVSFFQEDVKDAAEIRASDAQTARTLVDGGFEPMSVTDFIRANDITLLKHTGLVSVQLQPPGTVAKPDPQPDPVVSP